MTIKSSNGIFGAGSTGTARISPALISVMNSSTSEEISISPALQMVLDRMRALPTYNPVGSVFTSPKRQNCYSEAGFKCMWSKLVSQAIAKGIVAERFTFHDLRAHYATHYKESHGHLPDLHSNKATTARVYDRSTSSKRQAL